MANPKPVDGDSFDDASPSGQWAEEVWRALATLNSVDAAAVRLVYSQRMTQSEVARHLGLPVSETKTRISAALRELSRILVPPDQSEVTRASAARS
jgi:DNA-directed RNA polymerase specialized sigma24 family protein